MITLQQLTELLGWASVVNIGFLLLVFITLTAMKGMYITVHKKMFGMSEDDLSRAYFQYMAQYKIVVFVFNLAPYVALKIMGQ